jgi:CBS domain-containing protein
MGTVREVLARKDDQVYTIPNTATALDAIHYMNEQRIGALVVTDGDTVAGMFTERDVLRRVVAAERPPSQLRVAEVMTPDVICCAPETPIDEVSRIMRDQRIRHLPVLKQDGTLLGLISIGDVNAYRAVDQEATITCLHEYITGGTLSMA